MLRFKGITALICISTAVLFLSAFAITKLNARFEGQTLLENNSSTFLSQEKVLENTSDKAQENVLENIQDIKVSEDTNNEHVAPIAGVDPFFLEIPAIGVNALIEHVGLTSERDMDMTSSIKNVAWYNLGPRPGETGSAVIGGHYGYPGPAVFRDLEKLEKGDVIYVKGSNGQIIKFVVRESHMYKADEIVPEVFFSSDDNAHLNLVTCNGTWISSLKTYNQRLVIFTDMIL